MQISQVLEKERDALRSELKHLKECQIRFLTLSVTATGIILSLGSKLGESYMHFIALAPLLILYPFSLIFFDKATTITRIVGYYRVLERMLIEEIKSESVKNYNYFGWENALRKFRDRQAENPDMETKTIQQFKETEFRDLLWLKSGSPYWTLSFATFLFLSSGSIIWSAILGFTTANISWYYLLVLFGFIVIGWTSYKRNKQVLWDLNNSYRSYNANEKMWEVILQKEESA